MSLKYKEKDMVRVKVKIIEGEVLKSTIIDNEVNYLIEWTDGESTHTRYYKESELELVE